MCYFLYQILIITDLMEQLQEAELEDFSLQNVLDLGTCWSGKIWLIKCLVESRVVMRRLNYQ